MESKEKSQHERQQKPEGGQVFVNHEVQDTEQLIKLGEASMGFQEDFHLLC